MSPILSDMIKDQKKLKNCCCIKACCPIHAAAPELLAACKALIKTVETWSEYPEYFEEIEKAIATAEGRT